MKKSIFGLFLSFILLFVSISAVFAKDDINNINLSPPGAAQKREKAQELKERLNLKENTATGQAGAKQKVAERIKKIFRKAIDRLNSALIRLDKIAQRIASRIDKLKAKGVDTSKAEQKLADAKGLGLEAKSAISKAKDSVDAIDPKSGTPKETVLKAMQDIAAAKKALFAYHKALVAATRELKAAAGLREGTESAK